MPADPHHGAASLTKPQQRMLRALLDSEQVQGLRVHPYRSTWRTAAILADLELVEWDSQPSAQHDYLKLTEAGRQWAQTLAHLGKPAGYVGFGTRVNPA